MLTPIFAILDPTIKIFIYGVMVLGPISIIGIIAYLKMIEKKDPTRIRWR